MWVIMFSLLKKPLIQSLLAILIAIFVWQSVKITKKSSTNTIAESVKKNDTDWKKFFLDTPAFDKSKSYNTLKGLARSPFDLTSTNVDHPLRIKQYQAKNSGWKYIYAFERIDDTARAALFELARERQVVQQIDRKSVV